ncbi:uncharacterized protein LOC141806124 [Halichoeres trimaculatus]|uniref:uncharacterized protein LOC141806124 n=1 Tax=Halichoeres trimaculatus TaxID=147232 RepID=UPI003D9E60A2
MPSWRRPGQEEAARQGTGQRHPVQKWPISTLTRKSYKLLIPPESADKEFVLLVGDSHLRVIVDGFVEMPKGLFSFGIMSTPGAAAQEERIELIHAVVPRSPAAVVLLAPSNNLTHSKTIDSTSADFAMLLCAAMDRWSNVAVLDFPPRISSNLEKQEALRQQYHRVAARMVNPFTQWTTVQQGRKRKASGELAQSSGMVPKKWMVVKECTIPLTPVWFSAALLDEMEKLVPSHLPSPTRSTAVPERKQKAIVERRKAAVSKRSRFVWQAKKEAEKKT